MTDKDTESKHQEDHLAARAEVIRQYGDLWRQAIVKSGVLVGDCDPIDFSLLD